MQRRGFLSRVLAGVVVAVTGVFDLSVDAKVCPCDDDLIEAFKCIHESTTYFEPYSVHYWLYYDSPDPIPPKYYPVMKMDEKTNGVLHYISVDAKVPSAESDTPLLKIL